MKRCRRIAKVALVLALAAAGPVGCGTTDTGARRQRSLVFDSFTQRRLAASMATEPGLPWYAARNDAELGVTVGIASPTLLQSDRRVFDRQRSSRGRVFDHFNATTYRREFRREIR